MDRHEFERGFLRIAGRTKSEGERRSIRFQRRFTGAKGVGRLAAHKLAERLEIESWRWDGRSSDTEGSYKAFREGLRATIDWAKIEAQETLDQINEGVHVESLSPNERRQPGTKLRLTRLRRRWTSRMLDAFLSEVGTLTPLKPLIEPPPSIFGRPLLFSTPIVRDSRTEDPGFELHLCGDFAPLDELIAALPEAAVQLIEIECDSSRDFIRFGVAPSKEFAESTGAVREVITVSFAKAITDIQSVYGDPGPISFQARIYERSGTKEVWPPYAQAIRVYMEGFRVMPYGEPSDDWLELKSEYTKRAAGGFLYRLQDLDIPQGTRGETGVLRPDQAYMGAVFLQQNKIPGLQMLVNREGFLPNATFHAVAKVVRIGIDLATRFRYAATSLVVRERAKRSEDMAAYAAKGNVRQPPSAALLQDNVRALLSSAQELRHSLTVGDLKVAQAKLSATQEALATIETLTAEAAGEQSMLRVLASLGTQLSAFSHEIGQLVPTAQAIVRHLEKISQELDNSTKRKIKFGELKQNAEILLRGIERQSVYLVEITGAAGRRRRTRLNFAERFDAALKLVTGAIKQKNIAIDNRIPEDLRSPPMFPAELTMVFANLLTNAVKAAGDGGRILISGRDLEDVVAIRMENTGEAVDLSTAERWFRPFMSKTETPDAVLGQGMGLGLTITRSILDEYGARISFVRPSRGYQTAIEMRFLKR